MNNKFKSYSFWIAVSGAVGIVFVNLGKVFGFSFNSDLLTEIVDSICGVLIMFGILTISNNGKKTDDVSSDVLKNVESADDKKLEVDAKNQNESFKRIDNKKNENLKNNIDWDLKE